MDLDIDDSDSSEDTNFLGQEKDYDIESDLQILD